LQMSAIREYCVSLTEHCPPALPGKAGRHVSRC